MPVDGLSRMDRLSEVRATAQTYPYVVPPPAPGGGVIAPRVPAGIVVKPPVAWGGVEAALQTHHSNPDLEAARAVCAAMAAHRLSGAPVWPMLVAPPGSMKTHLLGGFRDLPGVHFVDHMTPQTFLSGQLADPDRPSQHPPSLLHRIGTDGILIYPDFSTVLAMKQEAKASILADMRRIYDGELRKEFGTSDSPSQEWKGRITFAVAVTPDIDAHYSIFTTLGERFVMIRSSRASGVEAAMAAMMQDTRAAKTELAASMQALFGGLPKRDPELPKHIALQIAALTEMAVRARTHMSRVGYRKELLYVPEAESPTRLAQQLAQLAKGSALIAGRDTVGAEDFRLVERVAFDCMPPTRSKILGVLIGGGTLRDVALPKSTLSYAKEDLEAQELLRGDELSPLATKHLELAGLLPGA